jgi:hypothetical protein
MPTAPTYTAPSTSKTSTRLPGFFGFGQDAVPPPDAEVPGTEDSPPPGVTVQAPIEVPIEETPPRTDATVEAPIYKKWWFWAAIGGAAVVGGGAFYFVRKGKKSSAVEGIATSPSRTPSRSRPRKKNGYREGYSTGKEDLRRVGYERASRYAYGDTPAGYHRFHNPIWAAGYREAIEADDYE